MKREGERVREGNEDKWRERGRGKEWGEDIGILRKTKREMEREKNE